MIDAFFFNQEQIVLLTKDGEDFTEVGRFNRTREVSENDVVEPALREQAEELRQRIAEYASPKVDEARLVALLSDMEEIRQGLMNDHTNQVEPEVSAVYAASLRRAFQRLRTVLEKNKVPQST